MKEYGGGCEEEGCEGEETSPDALQEEHQNFLLACHRWAVRREGRGGEGRGSEGGRDGKREGGKKVREGEREGGRAGCEGGRVGT